MTDWVINSEERDNQLTAAGQTLVRALVGESGRIEKPHLKVEC